MWAKTILLAALAVLVAVLGRPAYADWSLRTDDSSVSFTTVKADHVAENHRFDAFSGLVTEQGNIRLTLPLNATNTGIAIRDERIRNLLFADSAIDAVITAQVDPGSIPSAGATVAMRLPLNVAVVGVELSLVADVLVTRFDENRVMVSSSGPVLLNVERLGWASGVEKLREIAGLPSISHAVPVSFVLQFQRDS